VSTHPGKHLAWLLRHAPEAYELEMDSAGWVVVDVLLQALGAHGRPSSRTQLEAVVAEDDKRRFTFSADRQRIRAAQGHSVAVDLGLAVQTPPPVLFHGTPTRAWASIQAEGLVRRARHHVHLSDDPATAQTVGDRRGPALVLQVDSAAMHRDGHSFLCSDNGVWLCGHVPAAYLSLASAAGPHASAAGPLASAAGSGDDSPVSTATPLELCIHDRPGGPGALTLTARAWGRPEGRPVLAMHGWLDNAATFDELAPRLCAALDLRIVSLDLPGHGHSQHKHGHYHFVDWVADALAAADALGWARLTLMGHSMGAGISTLVAGAAPKRIEQLVLIEGLGPMSEDAASAPHRLGRAIERAARRRGISAKPKRAYPTLELAAERLVETVPMKPESAAILVTRGMRLVEPGTPEGEHLDQPGWIWRADPRLRFDSRLRLTEDQIHAFLGRIACPTLLVGATRGWPFDAELFAARREAVPDLERVVLEGGHHLHLDIPDAVAEPVIAFLKQL